jgi:hypothetical protein
MLTSMASFTECGTLLGLVCDFWSLANLDIRLLGETKVQPA